MDYLGVAQFDAYVAACAGRAGVAVVWDKPDSVPRTDGKTIWIPRLTSKTGEDALMRLRMCIKHETSHIVDSDFEFLRGATMSKLEGMVNNLVEDYRIDFRNDMEFRGDIAISEAFYAWMAVQVVERAKGEDGDAWIKLLPLFMWDCSMRSYLASAALVVEAGRTVIAASTESMERYGKLMAGTYGEELLALLVIDDKTEAAKAVLKLAKRIVAEVFPENASKEEEQDSPSAGAGSASGSTDAEDEAEEGISDEDIIEVTSLVSAPHEPSKSETGVRFIGEREEKPAGWILPAMSDYVVIRGDKMPEKYGKFCSDTINPTARDIVETRGRSLANHLRVQLQTRSKDRYETGVRKGKLHSGSLHRVLSGDAKQAERVFKRRVVSTTLDTAVTVLVDCSGSMCGSKYTFATATAGTISAALGPLHIAHSVLGFTCEPFDGKEEPLMRWFKGWEEPAITSKVLTRMGQLSSMLGQNADGDSVAYAYSDLLQRKETRKMLIVLSDGTPCGRDWAGNGHRYLKDVVAGIEKAGKVEVYGIGILDASVSTYYKNNTVLNSLDTLIPTVLQTLNRI
jgi:Cobalamin biosynthesis protein CobT VWA domain